MSDVWHIFVVEGEAVLNQNLITSLRKDGYSVQGATNGADAVRVLWSEEYDVVICDLKTPGVDDFELLQWLRAYRPSTRIIMVGDAAVPAQRMQALESGAVSYLEKPLDLRLLKEELRRLLQQNGFTASLDSFDLLDVIQIINMSRKSITLLINTGLEERGTLRFQNGELSRAEYGVLRGEEAFFALAAHKNGTVTQQPWDEQVVANVTQPLSRLIFQALQYRTKYANIQQQFTGEQEAIPAMPFSTQEVDDSPFIFLPEELEAQQAQGEPLQAVAGGEPVVTGGESREWWERTGKITNVYNDLHANNVAAGQHEAVPTFADVHAQHNGGGTITPAEMYKTPANQHVDLPSWLTDQPTASDLPAIRPAARNPVIQTPPTPVVGTTAGEWQMPTTATKTTEDFSPRRTDLSEPPAPHTGEPRQTSSPEWLPAQSRSQPLQAQLPDQDSRTRSDYELGPQSQPLQAQSPIAQAGYAVQSGPLRDTSAVPSGSTSGIWSLDQAQQSSAAALSSSSATIKAQRATAKRNYAALVSALQTLGYSIPGFIAAAVVSIEGQPVAQVAVDDLDISTLCKYFSALQQGALQVLEQGGWGDGEEVVITSTERHILMRVIGMEKRAFQVLITTREANPVDSLAIMANVEGTMSAALR